MHQYKELKLWQKAIEFVSEIYLVTLKFPNKERFNLITQLNRAAVSIPSNIAEGEGRNSDKGFLNFLAIAHASSYEVETELFISKNLGYLLASDFDRQVQGLNELQKMNFSFHQKLKSNH
jgi:four helix bundle protein